MEKSRIRDRKNIPDPQHCLKLCEFITLDTSKYMVTWSQTLDTLDHVLPYEDATLYLAPSFKEPDTNSNSDVPVADRCFGLYPYSNWYLAGWRLLLELERSFRRNEEMSLKNVLSFLLLQTIVFKNQGPDTTEKKPISRSDFLEFESEH
jgi:hypothetical protein